MEAKSIADAYGRQREDLHVIDTAPELQRLSGRIGRVHLRQRLGLESDHATHVLGKGRNFFHIENWYSIHAFIRLTLRCLGLYKRGRRNAQTIQIRRNEVRLARLPMAFDGFTLLHLSDLHLDMGVSFPPALSERLEALEYDICVITGDFRAKTFGDYQPALAALAQVLAHINKPVYAVLGNHDTIKMVPSMEAMGITLLMNESVPIQRGGGSIHLAGVDDPHYFQLDNIEKAVHDMPPDEVSILLSHSPEIYRRAAHAGFNLMLSGHTHGGQICLPGGIALMTNAACPRRYCRGAWQYHHMQGYTSAGSGVAVVDVRLNCPPEITLHQLRCIQ